MLTTTFKENRFTESFGVRVRVDRHGFHITTEPRGADRLLVAEIYRGGVLLDRYTFPAWLGLKTGILGVNPAECGVRVLDMLGDVVAILDVEEDPFPFMRPPAEQQHITENYVSVPPALTITDETGAVWTLGMTIAPEHKSPDGEFAFPVVRNGIDMGEIASRIERRGGKVKIFTCEGWKVFTGRSFF